jgi:hypothetical protein
MTSLASVLRAEIQRALSRERQKARKSVRKLRGEVARLRSSARHRDRRLEALQRRVERLRAQAGRALRGAAQTGRTRAAAYSAEAVRALRRRFGLSRKKFAALLEVSPGSIFGWETGRTQPRGRNVGRLRAVQGWSVSGALAKLGLLGAPRPKKKRSRPARRG